MLDIETCELGLVHVVDSHTLQPSYFVLDTDAELFFFLFSFGYTNVHLRERKKDTHTQKQTICEHQPRKVYQQE